MVKNFVVYKSSAGSGKTFTLVKEYLRLSLLDEKKLSYNFKRILAVTFTNKAAAEMKNRVVQALYDITASKPDNVLSKKLQEELAISESELKKRSAIVLSNILHHYADLSIGTIDSFTHKIVKTFAHDLELPVNFNIELDTQGFYEKVIASLFSKIGEDEYVSKLLKDYALSKAQDNASWDPEMQIRDFSKLLQKENSGEHIAKLLQFSAEELEDFRKQFLDYTRHYKQTLKHTAAKALKLISEQGLDDDDFHFKKSGPQNFFRKCFENDVDIKAAAGSRIAEALEKNKWAGAGSPDSLARINNIAPQLNSIARELIDFILSNHSYYSLCELLLKQMHPLMLLKKIEEISRDQKQEERLVFISEFNQKIFDVINNEPTPFIYERLGERYQHYLLDEFQDTSALQWQNLLPLLDNSLANGWSNLIVGDGKQSIYRWRNANVKQFADLPAIDNPANNFLTHERGQSLLRNHESKVLDENFRSLTNIVEFNNRFFEDAAAQLLSPETARIYEMQKQKAAGAEGGYVSLNTGAVNREEVDTQTLQLIHNQIKSAVASGFGLNDICILCRTNDNASLVADDLITKGIQVISSESLLLKNNFEVRTVLAMLRYLCNQQDKLSAAEVINYLCQSGAIPMSDLPGLLKDLSGNIKLSTLLAKYQISLKEEELAFNNLFDNVAHIIKALGLEKHAYHYLRFFLDEVNEFLVQNSSNIAEFIEHWETRSSKASMIIPDSTKAVKIMTVHSSKGLEFPVVIIPYCTWPFYRPGEKWVEIKNEKVGLPVSVVNISSKISASGLEKEFEAEQQAQVLDNLNLLYVAFTRAVERLHIISIQSEGNKKPSVGSWVEGLAQKFMQHKNNGFYEFGEIDIKKEKAKPKRLQDFVLEPLQFTSGSDQIKIKTGFKLGNEEAEVARKHGILIHWLLSQIKSSRDIEAAIETGVLSGEIQNSEKETLRKHLQEICSKPGISEFFKEGLVVKSEAELISPNGEILRPDRIVFGSDATHLIDFKTGKENEKVYGRQLQRYAEALQQMGYKQVKKYLLYLDEARLVELN